MIMALKAAYGPSFSEAVEDFRYGEIRFAFNEKKANPEPVDKKHRRLGFYPAPICYAYGAGRRLSSSSLSRPAEDDAARSLFHDDAELRNAEEWLLQLDYSASKESEIQQQQKKRIAQVKGLLKEILPEVEDIRFTEPTKERRSPIVEFQTPYGWVSLRQLSYGYRTLIAWMVDFASRMVERYPDSPDPLAEPAVVLVDEIDLHLHPTWQRSLIGYLTERFPNTQFIATATAP
jgi:predicted ATP-binding protein involved in virulence